MGREWVPLRCERPGDCPLLAPSQVGARGPLQRKCCCMCFRGRGGGRGWRLVRGASRMGAAAPAPPPRHSHWNPMWREAEAQPEMFQQKKKTQWFSANFFGQNISSWAPGTSGVHPLLSWLLDDPLPPPPSALLEALLFFIIV